MLTVNFTDLQQHFSVTGGVLLDLKLNTLAVLYLLGQRCNSLYVCCLKALLHTVKAPLKLKSINSA